MKKVQFRLAECNAILGKDSGEKRKYGSIFNKKTPRASLSEETIQQRCVLGKRKIFTFLTDFWCSVN